MTNDEPRAHWDRLYEDAFPRLFKAVAAATGDRDAALEGLHEAYLEGLRRPPRSQANLAGWLYRVALRKARRRPIVRWLCAAQTDEIASALDRIQANELLALLTPRQREIVVGSYFLGLTQEDIARALDLKRGTVAATLSQALTRMQRTEVREGHA